jgi:hypothetical protein
VIEMPLSVIDGDEKSVEDIIHDNYSNNYDLFRFREVLKRIIYLDKDCTYKDFLIRFNSNEACFISGKKILSSKNTFNILNIDICDCKADYEYDDFSTDILDFNYVNVQNYYLVRIKYYMYETMYVEELLDKVNSILDFLKNNYDADLTKIIRNVHNRKFLTSRVFDDEDITVSGFSSCVDGQIKEAQRLAQLIKDENLPFTVDEKLDLRITRHRTLKPYEYIFLDSEKLVNDRVFTIEY